MAADCPHLGATGAGSHPAAAARHARSSSVFAVLPATSRRASAAFRTLPAPSRRLRSSSNRRRWTGSRRLCQSRSMSKTQFDVRAILAGEAPRRHACHRQGLGAHATRLQGRHLVRASLRRIVLPPGAGGGAEHAAELRRRGAQAHRRLRHRGDRHDRPLARQGPAVRDAGHGDQGDRLGRRPGHLSDLAQAPHDGISCARSRTCGRAPT